MDSDDANFRPLKRQRPDIELAPIPPDKLLLALPSLLLHPPTHRQHLQGVALAQHALRRCLALPGIDRAIECRAWTALAELGLGCLQSGQHGVEGEIEKALTKALVIANQHPALQPYAPHLTRLSARLAQYQGNPRFAVHALQRGLPFSGLPHAVLTAHLALVQNTAPLSKRLAALSALPPAAGHLAHVIRLHLLLIHGAWTQVPAALAAYDTVPTPNQPSLHAHFLALAVLAHTYAGDADAATCRLTALHALIDAGGADLESAVLEVPFDNSPPLYIAQTHPRVMHALIFLVSAAAKRDAVGRKPRKAVFAKEGLAVLARSGFGGSSNDRTEAEKEITLPAYATRADLALVRTRLLKIRADLLGEVVNVSIMRSEFDEAESALNELIAHTRTHSLFSAYAARISLQQAQLAHALGQTQRAITCYQVAAFVASGPNPTMGKGHGRDDPGEDEWVRVAARAGEMWLRIGVVRTRRSEMESSQLDSELQQELYELRKEGTIVARECAGMGGTLMAVGEVISACLATEYLSAKQHLRRALDLATRAQDNHMRAVVLALSASHYLHTARDNAGAMLATCEQLAAGLGASAKKDTEGDGPKKPKDAVGNAHLRLWVGERFLELHRWSGDMEKAERQAAINVRLREAVERIRTRT